MISLLAGDCGGLGQQSYNAGLLLPMSPQGASPIGPYPADRIAQFHEYDPDVLLVVRRITALIRDKEPWLCVEHVGSTAVPGCGGKGIVDLVVLYPHSRLELARQVLEILGFQHQTVGFIFPENRPCRTGSLECNGKTFLLHAHVLEQGCEEADQLRSFRDRLIADPQLRAAYIERKRAIIESGVTKALDYTMQKGEFIRKVLAETSHQS